MLTKFTATKKSVRDYFPPGIMRCGHVDGADCPCNPFESELNTTWDILHIGQEKHRVGIRIEVVITHREIIQAAIITPIVRMPVYEDDKLAPGQVDTVAGFLRNHRSGKARVDT